MRININSSFLLIAMEYYSGFLVPVKVGADVQ
jgi:hypothetical protein